MAIYLNTSNPYHSYKELVNSRYFIDKSNLIEELNERISTNDKYVCITRPRKFGKTSIINMLGAYYSKSVDSSEIFNNLEISKTKKYNDNLNKYNDNLNKYNDNLNKYNVIKIDFSELPDGPFEYKDYIKMLEKM